MPNSWVPRACTLQILAALVGTSEKALYQETVCLVNKKGSGLPVISDFNLEFIKGTNLSKVQDDLDANTLAPDGAYLLGELRSDLSPSGENQDRIWTQGFLVTDNTF